MKMERIGRRNYVVTFALDAWDLNLHFITGERYNYVIDTGLGSGSMAPILAWLQKSPKPVVVVNTHFHWDHIWGNHCFGSALIVSHRLCREIIAEKWDDMLLKNRRYVRGTAEKALPNLVFEQALHFPDDGIQLLYTPGHTVDCISVYDERDKVLNAGDNIGDTLDELVPNIETDKAVFAQTMRACQQLGVAACVSGHNVLLGPAVFGQILDLL
ncbi:MAG: MBL fold metallo-hydrolase [Ruminococcaceae bacterium]|nr:MBL fold metallo-hydrolase [Oscillospiraceae bacterium]